eukprot:Blabericola_migrator_1__1847@NODE_1500_length_4404_cov_54_217662_g599_i2_p2_GENE_NODE_1500_length_4404_cov_54_217662_g599_i2NODE_1500_length_4404_cov_54_217662_g599_i2_p2_ORF_typecomplete_len190_score28_48_NODE_1500_length_4404_cov_54_217662_g599_i293662
MTNVISAFVRPIVERPFWLTMDSLQRGPFGVGVLEEGQFWLAVLSEFGEGFAELFHPGRMAKVMPPWDQDRGLTWHWDCWTFTALHCNSIGTDGSIIAPVQYNSLKEDGLRQLLIDPYVWSFRKVSDTTRVNESILADYLFDFWNSSNRHITSKDHPALKEPLVWSKRAKSVDDLVRVWRANGVFGLKS